MSLAASQPFKRRCRGRPIAFPGTEFSHQMCYLSTLTISSYNSAYVLAEGSVSTNNLNDHQHRLWLAEEYSSNSNATKYHPQKNSIHAGRIMFLWTGSSNFSTEQPIDSNSSLPGSTWKARVLRNTMVQILGAPRAGPGCKLSKHWLGAFFILINLGAKFIQNFYCSLVVFTFSSHILTS